MNTTTNQGPQEADEVQEAADDAGDTVRAQARHAVDATGRKVRDWQADVESTIKPLARRAQQAMERGLDTASKTSAEAQRHARKAADRASRYVADQPMRSVLAAAAAGAAIAALIMLLRPRGGTSLRPKKETR